MFNKSTEYFCHHEAINQACDCYDQVIAVVKKAVATMEVAQFSYNQIHETIDSILFSFDNAEEVKAMAEAKELNNDVPSWLEIPAGVDNAADSFFWKE